MGWSAVGETVGDGSFERKGDSPLHGRVLAGCHSMPAGQVREGNKTEAVYCTWLGLPSGGH